MLFAGNPLPMWIYDVESLRFLEANESAEDQYGYTRTEFLALTLNDILPVQNIDVVQEVVHGSNPDSACIHLKKDGTPIHVKLRTNDVRFRGRHGSSSLSRTLMGPDNQVDCSDRRSRLALVSPACEGASAEYLLSTQSR